ncbi:MAG TPA: hypothetical protein VNI54_04635 [Thermoanaerobaculia bacterium]|nr:hypothetical protein [Thermoanaerobaculia bacterium]
MRTLLAAIILATLATACGGPYPSPQHHLVLVPDLQRTADAAPQLETWMRDSLTAAGSTFRVCAPNADAEGARCTAPIIVPVRWGPHVLRAKAAFRADSMRMLQDAAGSLVRWQSARSVEFPPDTVLSADRTTVPVDLARWATGTSLARHVILLCDRSPSIGTADACSMASLLALYDRWLGRAAPEGSSLTILRIGRDLPTTAELFSVQTPAGSAAARLLALLDARARVAALPLERDRDAGSAIVEAMYIAADRLRTRTGEKEIVLLSDGRQLSALGDFDTTIPNPEPFIAAIRNAGLAPDLRHVEFGLCGFHFGGLREGAPQRAAARADQARRSAWTAAGAAFGPTRVHVATRCSDLPTAQSIEEDMP